MKFLLHTSKNHFRWLFHLKRDHYNLRRKKQLENKGYEFIHIEKFEKLRKFNDYINFKWDKDYNVNTIHKNNNKPLNKTIRLKK